MEKNANCIPALTEKLQYLVGREPVAIVCIGSDLFGGGCLGPLVGHMLGEADIPAYIYGNFEFPVTALNVNKIGGFVRSKHPLRKIIAVDSMIGKKDEIGKIVIEKGALRPGAADGKNLKPIGDIAVTAVTSAYKPGEKQFAGIRLGLLFNLARLISQIIASSVSFYNNTSKKAIFNSVSSSLNLY